MIAKFIVKNSNGIEYLIAPHIQDAGGIKHIFTTRGGGVSTGALNSLNLGMNRPEPKENIIENYRRACSCVGMDYKRCVLAQQVHSTNIRQVLELDVGKGISCQSDITDTDGFLTNISNIPMAIFYADCVPILIYDPKTRAASVVHAGWRGTVGKIAANAIKMMIDKFSANPKNILVAIGPCIGACHFETGKEIMDRFSSLGLNDTIEKREESYYIDLTLANEMILEGQGVDPKNIISAGECTCCNSGRYFSHRECGADTGRMALIAEIE